MYYIWSNVFQIVTIGLGVLLLYPRREAGILWIHHRCRPQRFLVSDLQSTFLSGFLSYLAGGLIW